MPKRIQRAEVDEGKIWAVVREKTCCLICNDLVAVGILVVIAKIGEIQSARAAQIAKFLPVVEKGAA